MKDMQDEKRKGKDRNEIVEKVTVSNLGPEEKNSDMKIHSKMRKKEMELKGSIM